VRRRALSLLVAPLLLFGSVACGSDSGSETENGSSSIDDLKVSGKAGEAPTVQIGSKPFEVKQTESDVLTEGDGEQVAADGNVLVNYVGVNGRSGKEFDSSWKNQQPVPFSLNGVVPGFKKGLTGKHVGDRVLIAMPAKDGYGKQGQPDAGIKGGDSLVFVVDLLATYGTQAEGEEVQPPKDAPTLKLANGQPESLEIPKGDPPKGLVTQPLIKGEGEQITEKSLMVMHVLAANWRTGKTVDSTWAQQSPTLLPLDQSQIEGLNEGVIGQTVGSRVQIIVPPDKGLGQDIKEADVKKDDTLVFVVDILAAA
jgi:peptidylprolyl isomerase